MSQYINITDATLRDGMHSVAHQFTPEQMAKVAAALEAAGVDAMQVGHGDGIGGASYNFGFSAATNEEYLDAVSAVVKRAKICVTCMPGIGTREHLRSAHEHGANMVRIATHCTEADISEQHVGLAKQLGMEAVGVLMLTHMNEPEGLAQQAKLLESYGADMVSLNDSAGAMLPRDVAARISTVKQAIKIPVSFHAHNNLGMAIANCLAALEAGATSLDGSLCGFGAGAGNAQTEVLVAVLQKLGYRIGVDLYKVMDAAEDLARPMLRRPPVSDRAALSCGYAGVVSSFLLHSFKAAERFGLEPRDILMECGRRRVVSGQEDMCVDVASELAARKGKR